MDRPDADAVALFDDASLPDEDALAFTLTAGGGDAADRAAAVVAAEGAVVLGGVTEGELEPGKKAGGKDIFLARYGADRERVWVRQIGSEADDILTAVARDEAGDIYAIGYTYGDLGGENRGKADIVVAKFTGAGEPVWVKQFGSVEEDTADAAVASGTTLYIGGATEGKLFPGDMPRGADGFIMALDRDGAILRSTLAGSDGEERVTALFAEGTDTLYAAGTTAGALHGNSNYGATDGFLCNYDLSLARRWTRQFGTAGADDILAGAAAGERIALGGRTFGSFDDEINEGNYDALLLLFDRNGDRLFARQHGNDGPDAFYGVAFMAGGSVVAAGASAGAVFTQPAAGGYETITVRYDVSGERTGALQYGTAGDDGVYGVAAEGEGAILTGTLGGSVGGADYFLMDIKW